MEIGIADVFFDMDVISRYWPDILASLGITIWLAFLITLSGMLLGTVLAVIRNIGIVSLSRLVIAYVDILRTLPPLVMLILVFFCAPYLDISISPFVTTWLTLSVILSAYVEESLWSGMRSLPNGQFEAARSTGLSWLQTMYLVILPQVYRMVLAPLTSKVISVTRDTALGSAIGLTEILGASQSAASHSGNPSPLTVSVLLYLLLFLPIVVGSRYMEKHWKWEK